MSYGKCSCESSLEKEEEEEGEVFRKNEKFYIGLFHSWGKRFEEIVRLWNWA